MTMDKKDIAVIGLGIFGYEVAIRLQRAGHDVLAVDIDKNQIERIKDDVTGAVCANITDVEALKELDIGSFDIVVLGLGSNFEQLILGLTYLKKLAAKHVIVRANTEVQQEILLKIGADEVVLPEKQSAQRCARNISAPNIMELLELDEEVSLSEISVTDNYAGKTLKELNLRQKYGITALLLKRNGHKTKMITDPAITLMAGDCLVVVGRKEDIVQAFT